MWHWTGGSRLFTHVHPPASWGFSLRPLDIQSPARPPSTVNESARTNVTRCLSQEFPTPPAMPSLPPGIIRFTSNLPGPVLLAQRAALLAFQACLSSAMLSGASAMGTQTNQAQCALRNGTQDLRPAGLHPVSKPA